MISNSSTLRDVAFEVCSGLRERGLRVILVGGSAATYYSDGAYQSDDLDFVAYFDVDAARQSDVIDVMTRLGYELRGNTFEHQSVHERGKTLEVVAAIDSLITTSGMIERP